jgi:hypothetical protein
MIAVYVAGKMSSTNPLEFLRNLNALQDWTAHVRELGYAPFPVADDFADIMRTKDVTVEQVKEASIVWLRRADCMLVTPGWEQSPGTHAEIAEARRCGIPVFFDIEEMGRWAAGRTA